MMRSCLPLVLASAVTRSHRVAVQPSDGAIAQCCESEAGLCAASEGHDCAYHDLDVLIAVGPECAALALPECDPRAAAATRTEQLLAPRSDSMEEAMQVIRDMEARENWARMEEEQLTGALSSSAEAETQRMLRDVERAQKREWLDERLARLEAGAGTVPVQVHLSGTIEAEVEVGLAPDAAFPQGLHDAVELAALRQLAEAYTGSSSPLLVLTAEENRRGAPQHRALHLDPASIKWGKRVFGFPKHEPVRAEGVSTVSDFFKAHKSFGGRGLDAQTGRGLYLEATLAHTLA